MKVKIFFSDFWGGFDPLKNPFIYFLREAGYDPVIDANPDYLIFSVFGNSHEKYTCKKIFYTGENRRPDFSKCDYAISFDFLEDSRNLRLPFYSYARWHWYFDWTGEANIPLDAILKPKKLTKDLSVNRKFCCFLQGNGGCRERNEFFHKLSAYKKVDSAGSLFNNTGFVIPWSYEKLKFISDYKFIISFENSSYPGYVTEKIFEPLVMGTVPIYWGSPNVDRDFNDSAYINSHKFDSQDEVIQRVIELDNNDDLYYEMYKANPLYDEEKLSAFLDYENVFKFFKKIIG